MRHSIRAGPLIPWVGPCVVPYWKVHAYTLPFFICMITIPDGNARTAGSSHSCHCRDNAIRDASAAAEHPHNTAAGKPRHLSHLATGDEQIDLDNRQARVFQAVHIDLPAYPCTCIRPLKMCGKTRFFYVQIICLSRSGEKKIPWLEQKTKEQGPRNPPKKLAPDVPAGRQGGPHAERLHPITWWNRSGGCHPCSSLVAAES